MIQVLKERLERHFKHGLLTEEQHKQAIAKLDNIQSRGIGKLLSDQATIDYTGLLDKGMTL